jgi:hypothetical protein
MPQVRIILWNHTAGAEVSLFGDQPTPTDPVDVDQLTLVVAGHTQECTRADSPFRIDNELLNATATSGVFTLKRDASRELVIQTQWVFATGAGRYFGVKFGADASLVLSLRVPVIGIELQEPFLVLCATGRIEANATGPVHAGARIGYCVRIDGLPSTNDVLPSLMIHPPELLPWPEQTIPWPSFPQLPSLIDGIKLPAVAFDVPGVPIRFAVELIEISIIPTGKVIVRLHRIRIEGVGGIMQGSLTIEWAPDGTVSLQFDGLPSLSNLSVVSLADGCFGFDGRLTGVSDILKLFGHDLLDDPNAPAADFKLRIHADAGEVDEIRLDWAFAADRNLSLPGITLEAAAPDMLTLLFRRMTTEERETRLTFVATFPQGKGLKAYTTFTWPDEGGEKNRELLPDSNQKGPKGRLIEVTATAAKPLSVAVFDFPARGGSSLPPRYFQALETPLSPLLLQETAVGVEDPEDPLTPDFFDFVRGDFEGCPTSEVVLQPITFQIQDPNGGTHGPNHRDIDLDFKVNVANPFEFPFLNFPSIEGNQFIQISNFQKFVEASPLRFGASLDLTVQIGDDLSAKTTIVLAFDLTRMAFSLDSTAFKKGIPFLLDGKQTGDFLGLKWELEGLTRKDNAQGLEAKTAFILAIDGRAFSLRKAPGAKFAVMYDKATRPDEPIQFNVDEFALTPKGLDLSASISDKPARLNGLETRFRFTEGVLQIKENRVAGFTIAGTGPLPPDLVGDAVADIAMQFAQVDGKVRLIRGSAKIRGPKLLSCKSTRFEFELDGIGLEFVNEGGADHLYFTLSGKARYKLAQGDNTSGPLAWLPGIEIQLVDCPLTGNARVIAKHVRFLIELPKPITFNLMGCFKMELRAIGFVPQFDRFGDDTAAMQLSGQIKFGDVGDVIDAKIDFHDLFVARPAPGKLIPRLYLKQLGVRIAQGDTFCLEAVVDFFSADAGDEIEPGIKADGFAGEGTVTIKGLPPIAATTAFLRVSPDAITWKRAWFLYLEARQLSFRIPVVEIYLREIGFGFGYRYTLASFKAADEITDVRLLLKRLKELSLTQGNLSSRKQWRVDLEGPGEDARWTVAFRALLAASSAQTSPFTGYDVEKEKELACLYIMDAVIAVRSDLTFFIAARGWLNTNYNDFSESVRNKGTLHSNPLLSGFALLSVKQSRFLANLSSNPSAEYGDHPPLPDFFKRAVRQSRFSATLLIEPGLVHYELGWPNQLSWGDSLGPLTAEFRGGAIFRLSRSELVVGNSFLARGKLKLSADFNAGFFGAEMSAVADVSYGARYIGVLDFADPLNGSVFYGAVGIEIRVNVYVYFWLRLKFRFFKISLDLRISFDLQFTAALQVAVPIPPKLPGALGTASLFVSIAGRKCIFNVRVGINDGIVEFARGRTERFLKMGLEAEDVEPVPGTTRTTLSGPTPFSQPQPTAAPQVGAAAAIPASGGAVPAVPVVVAPGGAASPAAGTGPSAAPASAAPGEFHVANYNLAMALGRYEHENGAVAIEDAAYFLLVPQSPQSPQDRDGFYPVPPNTGTPTRDFAWTLIEDPLVSFEHFDPISNNFEPHTDFTNPCTWKVKWDFPLDGVPQEDSQAEKKSTTLGDFLRYAYVYTTTSDDAIGDIVPQRDPTTLWVPSSEPAARRSDHRVDSPTNAAYESAARGAAEQFVGPHFKFDPNSEYDRALRDACAAGTNVYTAEGKVDPKNDVAPTADQAAVELRSSLVQAIVRDFMNFVEASKTNDTKTLVDLKKESLAFRLGLVLRVAGRGNSEDERRTSLGQFLDKTNTTGGASPFGEIAQRFKCDNEELSSPVPVTLFNPPRCSFLTRPANFNQVRVYTHDDLVVINWRLVYPDISESLGNHQDDPEQQLRHYIISREHIDGDDPPLVVTVKAGDVLHKEQKDEGQDFHVVRLRPRFQFSDQFRSQEAEGIAPLTAAGKTYLYTVTPIDLAGNASPRTLTVIATRYPAAPPLVPADGELTVPYVVPEDLGKEIDFSDEPYISIIDKEVLELRFSDPIEPPNQTFVPVNQYNVVFRREATLPVGFYGADEDIRGGQGRGLAVTNARVRRTDIVISFPRPVDDGTSADRAESGRKIRVLQIPVETLERHGVISPPVNGKRVWRPEGWRIFIQTESESGGGRPQGVRSSLAPVVVRLRFLRGVRDDGVLKADKSRFEERQAGLLEWVPNPVRFNLLGPTDCDGEVGFAKVPMPQLPTAEDIKNGTVDTVIRKWRLDDSGTGDGLDSLRFEQHPARTRAVKVRWNQGPSDNPLHPLSLHARYQVYEFDVFSNLGDVLTPSGVSEIDFREWAARANLRLVQEVDLVPASDLPKLPKNASDPLMWEAWYPAATRRLLLKRQQLARVAGTLQDGGTRWPEGTNVREVPWYSWSDSFLEWIDPGELVSVEMNGSEDVRVKRNAAYHPFLLDVASLIGMADANADADPFPTLFAEAGPQPSRGSDIPRDNVTNEVNVNLENKPGKLDLFLRGTAPDADPYGWGVLQRMGLAMGLRVRTGKPIEKDSPIPFTSGEKYSQDYPVGEYVLGHDLLALLRGVIDLQQTRHQKTVTPKDGIVTLQAPPGGETFYRLSNVLAAPVSRLAPAKEAKINLSSNAPLTLTYWGGEPTVIVGSEGASAVAKIDVEKHLHVEYLFQPGKRIRIASGEDNNAGDAKPEEMLALVQLSLRPAIQQLLRYRRFSLDGLEGGIPVQITFSQTGPFASVLQQTGVLSGLPAPLTDPTTITYAMPAAEPLRLIARLKDADVLTYTLKFGNKFEQLSTIDNPEGTGILITADPSTNIKVSLHFEQPSAGAWYRVWEGGTGVKKLITDGTQELPFDAATDAHGNLQIELFNVPNPARNAKARDSDNKPKAVKVLWTVKHDYVSPTDWPAANFPFQEAAPWAGGTNPLTAATHAWTRFRRYVRLAEPTISHGEMNPAPAQDDDTGKRNLAALLSWQTRFFLHGGDIAPNDGATVVGTDSHHWIASGYPRAASPMPLTPDAAGRITGFRPIEDLWAHAYRYFVRPRGRYELLWEDLGRSRRLINEPLIGELEARQKTLSVPEPGGADVALARIRPVAAPLVLSSRRLDEPTPPGVSAVPGKVWEVLVVKHTEQDLIERNRALVNHLEFRQTSQAIVRRFDSLESRLPDLQQAFSPALSPIYASSAADILPGIAKLKLVYDVGLDEEIDLAGGRTVGDVKDKIDAKKKITKLVATVRPVIDGTLTNGVQLVIKPDPDLPEFVPNLHIRLVTDEAIPRDLLSPPIDLSSNIIVAPVSDPNEPAHLPAVPAKPDHIDWQDLGGDAPSLDLPYRSTQFSQGLTAIQFQRLPFFYTHRMLLIAQTAHVVSPITVVDQKDFEYITPEIAGTLEGVVGADGKRYRKIVFPLGRFWDALTPEAQTEWALESPQTAATGLRRPSSLIDPSTTYTIVIARGESGNVEAIAEYRFNPIEPTGFESRTLPVPFRGEAVALTQEPTQNDPLRDPFHLETILLSLGRAGQFEEVVQIVSSRIAFANAPGLLRIWPTAKPSPGLDDVMFPRTAALRWHFGPDKQGKEPVQEFTTAEAEALRQLAANCDISYAEPLLRLLTAGSVRRIDQIGFERTAEACVGLEQLQEIHDTVKVEPEFTGGPFTSGSGKITWTGFLSPSQILVLTEWRRSSLFGETLNALLQELKNQEVFSDDLTAGAVDAALLATHQLDQRIAIVPQSSAERLQWKAALTTPPTQAELTNLANLRDALPTAEQPAVQALIDKVTDLDNLETEIPVVESFWRPRPTQNSTVVDVSLRDRLLFGNGAVGFTGLMTLQEGRDLRDLAGLPVPDKASVVTLFTRAANGGLGGGTLRLVVRRGSALPFASALLGKLDFI